MQADTATSRSIAEITESIGSVAENTGKQQMRIRVLKWLYRHRDDMPQYLVDSLVDEVSK